MKRLKIADRLTGYQDGKLARKVIIVVDDIIRREDMSYAGRRMWKKAINEDFNHSFDTCITYVGDKGATTQFWDWNCDVFISGHLEEPFGADEKATKPNSILFARRNMEMGWYGVNWNYDLEVGKRRVK